MVTPIKPSSSVIPGITSVLANAALFNVSLGYTEAVLPPVESLIVVAEKSLSTASIFPELTTIVTKAVSQFERSAVSHI